MFNVLIVSYFFSWVVLGHGSANSESADIIRRGTVLFGLEAPEVIRLTARVA